MFTLCLLDSKKIPTRKLLAAGLFLVALGAAWPHTLGAWLPFASNQNDFAQGFCYGLGITMEIFVCVALRRQRTQS